jgi:hypothetical protein
MIFDPFLRAEKRLSAAPRVSQTVVRYGIYADQKRGFEKLPEGNQRFSLKTVMLR